MFEQMPWDQADELWAELKTARDNREAIEKAIAISKRLLLRDSPDLKLMLEIVHKQIAGGERIWGRGETRGYVWSHPARVMGACAFKALQSTDRAAGEPERQRYTTPFLKFIAGLIAPICLKANVAVPPPRTIRNVLKGGQSGSEQSATRLTDASRTLPT
jgi:hypothetical protein